MKEGVVVFFYLGYIVSPWFGLYAAVTEGSFMNALFSVIVPWYGIIYWGLS